MKVYITQNFLTRKIEKLKETNILIHKKIPMNAVYIIALSTKLNILCHLKKTNLSAQEQ